MCIMCWIDREEEEKKKGVVESEESDYVAKKKKPAKRRTVCTQLIFDFCFVFVAKLFVFSSAVEAAGF